MTGALAPTALLRAAARHRVLLAAGLAAASVAAALQSLTPAHEPQVRVLAAAHDLPAGAVLGGDDVKAMPLPRSAVPAGVLTAAVPFTGRLVAAPLRRGETLTDVRLVGAGLLAGLADDGLVGVPVRLADAEAAALLQPGDVVDVLSASAGPTASGPAQVAAAAVRVLAVPARGSDTGEGALVLLAASPTAGARLAAAAVQGRLSVVVRPP